MTTTALKPIPDLKSITPYLVAGDYKSDLKPIWCPGCGDFGVVTAVCRALAAINRPPHEIAFISGIGCSSRIPGYTTAYGFNTVHGRAIPIAQGIKLANPELLVLVASGDGDGFSIGGGHLPHVIRRNIDLTYIVMDNQIYGLTKGQLSPTSPRGRKTVTSNLGSIEDPVNPLLYVMGYGASFVAQGSPADMNGLAKLIEEGIRFPGFAFINVQSPCVTYGEAETQLKAQKGKIENLAAMGHDPADRARAVELARDYGTKLYTGVLYRDPNPRPSYGEGVIERRKSLEGKAAPRQDILKMFVPSPGR
jgi:2-oxoglutarate ferredoxin oxidoreductase subunit beta